jgi:hypothetical protein
MEVKMTLAKASAVVLGLLFAVALGIWVGPYVTDRGAPMTDTPSVRAPATQPSPTAASSRRARARRVAPAPAVPASAPEVHARLKPLLNMGTNMEIASEGFRDAEQFAAVAHAARNTKVPFMVLKHRVLNERKTLAAAIGESKPNLNAAREARRARAEARSDLAALRG